MDRLADPHCDRAGGHAKSPDPVDPVDLNTLEFEGFDESSRHNEVHPVQINMEPQNITSHWVVIGGETTGQISGSTWAFALH